MRLFLCAALAAGALSGCGQDSGPAVSSSEAPRNEAVSTDGTGATADATATPGANSFTEEQARERITADGYTDVGALTQNAEGLWTGTATRDGTSATVAVDYRGTVTTQ